ncbi:MAG TPA: HAMP domain-containing histidine kinase [Hellea balneolensis]|uniref:histidine kinase n=1 Tax=Hellea balneolensis TaxID=287478 RepID=A0A7C5LVE8_9PROT|nr:HAMP domain-containing histidine kinase [Hellea balneolensis]
MFKKGNYKRAFRYQEKWANAEIAKLENLAFEDRRKASEQLALSEKLARTEFKSLRTKTRLQAEVIVQEKRFRKALTGLLIALLIIILMLIAARIKLKKVNAELEIAAELAKAGEKAKATFLAVMSHELRTPMNPIIALSNVLKNRIADPEDAKLLALINSSAEGLMDMIENIMAATEDADDKKVKFLETVELRPFLTELVKRFYEDACHKNLNFEMRYNPKLPDTIMTNKIGLKLLTNNILSNAVKFTESGTISVMVTIDPHRAETVLIVVKDTGVGLEMSELPNLLKAFEQRDSSFTRKFGGTGIGLYVAALKAKQIGADLDFQSVQGKGTQVEIRVPFTQTLDQIDEGSDTLTQAA